MNIVTSNISLDNNSISNFSKKIFRIWNFIGFEATIWLLGLFYLAIIHTPDMSHFTICPLSNLGFEFCPGCGLGNSISYLFRGDFASSFHSHPLGIFGMIIIAIRIISIIKNNWRRYA